MFGETEQERQRKRDLREFRYAVNERVLVRMSFSSSSKLLEAQMLTSAMKKQDDGNSELRLIHGVFHLYMPYRLLDTHFQDYSFRDEVKETWLDRVPFKFTYDGESDDTPYPATHREVMVAMGIFLGYLFAKKDRKSNNQWIFEAFYRKLGGFIKSGNKEMHDKTGVPLLK